MKKICFKRIILVLILFSTQLCHAANPLIVFQGPGISKKDYVSYIQTRPLRISYAEHFRSQFVHAQSSEEMRNLYYQAQEKYLNSSLHEARNLFEKITISMYQANWQISDKLLIVNSLFKLAQISESTADTDKYIALAAQFYPNHKLDPTLFPPPIVNRYENLKKSLTLKSLQILSLENFDEIYIDGERYALNTPGKILVFGDTHRFHLISNSHQDVVHVGLLEDLYEKAKGAEPKVFGNCHQYHVSGFHKNSYEALFASCPERITDNVSQTPNVEQVASASLWNEMSQSKQDRFYKSSGFWLSAALVIGVSAYYANQNQKEDTQPTRKSGWGGRQ